MHGSGECAARRSGIFQLGLCSCAKAITGVTIVQYRDKTSDTGVLIETARKLHKITQLYNVPLLIDDRVDVAIAAGVEGVHLGQDDMSMEPVISCLEK